MNDDTPTLWPAPPPRRGGRIRHGVLCPRVDPIVETTRRTPAGVILRVEMCTWCEATDLAERLLEQARHDDGPEAA